MPLQFVATTDANRPEKKGQVLKIYIILHSYKIYSYVMVNSFWLALG